MYSQKLLIDTLSSGKFGSMRGHLPRRVETVISNVFIGEQEVYKVYKCDSNSFNEHFFDLSVQENRITFSERDFQWNQKLSPEIYLKALYVQVTPEGIIDIVTSRELATELVIVMSKVDITKGLTTLLMNNLLQEGDYYKIGFQLGEKTEAFSRDHVSSPIDLYEDFVSRYKDIVSWMGMAATWLPGAETLKYLEFLKTFIEEHKQELHSAIALSGVGLDVHAENAIFNNGKLLLIDTYPPKEAWRRGHKHINLYRIATDIHALQGEKAYRECIAGYEEGIGDKLDQKFEPFFTMYAALIMCPYLYMISTDDPMRLDAANKYHEFLERYFLTIQ